jgi:hypothetical protein
LKRLKSLKVPGLREVTQNEDDRVLFHLNDNPIDMDVAKGVSKNDLKPDIVAVTLNCARSRQAHQTGGSSNPLSWESFSMAKAIHKPHKSFQWESLLCSHEVALVKKTIRGPPKHHAIPKPDAEVAIEVVQSQLSTAAIDIEAVPVPEPST